MIKPGRVALLHEPCRRVAHEQQFLIAEGVFEIGEKRCLATGNVERVVHEAACLWFIGQRNPGTSTAERERLLPRMGKIEGMSHFVASGPEDHPLHPGVWVWVSRRRLGNERVIEYSGSLAVVGADVIEHDATKRIALFMQGSEEHPHSPLRFSNE